MAKQSRKSSQSRRRRRRARRGGTPTVLVLLCALVAVVAIITAMTIFFKVQTFTLTGQTRYSKEELVAASGIQQGDNLILFDKFDAIDRIFDACPYLDTVQMRRRYPDRIEIIVTECAWVPLYVGTMYNLAGANVEDALLNVETTYDYYHIYKTN